MLVSCKQKYPQPQHYSFVPKTIVIITRFLFTSLLNHSSLKWSRWIGCPIRVFGVNVIVGEDAFLLFCVTHGAKNSVLFAVALCINFETLLRNQVRLWIGFLVNELSHAKFPKYTKCECLSTLWMYLKKW